MAVIYFNNHVSPHNPISNNCSKPEKITKYIVSHERHTETHYAYSHKKSGVFYKLKLVNGTTTEINESFIIGKTPMLLVTIVTDIAPWRNYHKKECNHSVETRKFAISTKDTSKMVGQGQDSQSGFERVQTIKDEK